MSDLRQDALRALWFSALAEPTGLLVQTTDFARLRALLYAERAKMRVPDLDGLQVRQSAFSDGNLVICHPPREPQERQ